MLKIYNVGKGDSMLFLPDDCELGSPPLLIDVGPKKLKTNLVNFAVTQLNQYSIINIMITHSHSDHIGALPQILTLAKSHNKTFKVDSLYIPYYMPEISRIYSFLSKKFRTNRPSIMSLPKIINSNINVIPVYDGYKLCCHSLVLNPPKEPTRFYYGATSLGEGLERDQPQPIETLERALNILLEATVIEEQNVPLIQDYDSPLFDYNTSANKSEYNEHAKAFVSRFFIALANVVQATPVALHHAVVSAQVRLSANQASIVFRHEDLYLSWLFTGDADEYVFERLINEKKNIMANVLKVPHHGSKENMSLHMLNSINPKYAIISHNNRSFNRSEPHPHMSVIELLERLPAQIFYTNAVKKPGVNGPIRPASFGVVGNGLLEFI